MDDCCIDYRVFIHRKLENESMEDEDELCIVLTEYSAYLSQFIGDYVWQNESFNLSLAPKQDTKDYGMPCLCGQTNYGDNVDDEWFIVFLLFKLSVKYPVSITVNDSDGNFLLIEAAHELPRWLNPETSENRVFIHDGNVHIIPLPSSPREITLFPTGIPTLLKALEIIDGPYSTLADSKIQQAIKRQIDGYPEKVHQSYHHANCLVSPSVKYLLDHKPTLISAAVQAFYHRDPIDMKAIKEAKHFPPTDRVLTRVRFTRCIYAQIMQQEFHPDRKAGWKIPLKTSTEYKAHQLGLKLICGFEILCSKSNARKNSTNKPSGAQWQQFLGFLTKQGYFKGEIEGSKLYNKLLSQAENHFVETLHSQHDTNKTPGDVVLSLLEDTDLSVEKMKDDEQNLPPEDDDTWLNISPDELDTILQNYSATGNMAQVPSAKINGNQEMDFDLGSVTQKMKSFVDKVSSHEGAEFPGGNENEEINFDADSFLDTMRHLLDGRPAANQSDDDDDDDFSDASGEEEDQEIQNETGELLSYMEGMDKELAQTKIGESFEKAKPSTDDIQDADVPVDVDLNLVKNFLESFSNQQGLAGPATNILNAMGLVLPRDDDGQNDQSEVNGQPT